MQGKSSRVSFNVAGGRKGSQKPKSYSYQKMVQKLDVYNRVTDKGSAKHLKDDLHDIKVNAFDRKEQENKKRGIQRTHLEQGITRGIHDENAVKRFDARNREADRKDIKARMAKAKKLYSHHGLSQHFDRQTKNKGMDKSK